ncbi:unnamed protein product [Parnassius apollo]|uniref:(apollo) hypothetical protein n=1 Tax=Parnassius apollo TaxID=110799 RepID=A0A8S3WKE1_PARAO|nr:unnamed protein product [Parnassius apollo]
MDNAAGGLPRRRVAGRRRLRIGALTLGAFLTMHCRIAAAALTGGSYNKKKSVVFMLFLTLAVMLLANPLRHFEVYLGQWSISGPGRAFRIIPVLDGIGIAICINAIVRAITCCTIAAIAAVYVVRSVGDDKLPFTYCRDFDLNPYDPTVKELKTVGLMKPKLGDENEITTLGLYERALRRNYTHKRGKFVKRRQSQQIQMCKETYNSGYPALFSTPAYNFFYVEVMSWRSDYNFRKFNTPLLFCIVFIWSVLWVLLVIERFTYGRLVWNNMYLWLVAIPWIWVILLAGMAFANLSNIKKGLGKVFRMGAKEALIDGLALLECVEAVMSGLATPYVCVLELVALIYVYRGHDFMSDINIATEENMCSTRINTQWHIIPFIAVVCTIRYAFDDHMARW